MRYFALLIYEYTEPNPYPDPNPHAHGTEAQLRRAYRTTRKQKHYKINIQSKIIPFFTWYRKGSNFALEGC